MAWNSDTSSSTDDDLDDTKPADNLAPGTKKVFGKTVVLKGAPNFTKVSKGIGTRKSTAAPKGSGRKGSTTKSNALKGA